ncbi:MAG TPA: hypothetical protein VNS56_01430 [Methylomirabilota bacterium]|nr:hypothetical protein [Methylomirabilota bacterium]
MTGPPPDPFETLFERGVTDGLPVVPPTRERVAAMVSGCGRDASELVALVPPNFGRATVEKIAVNAVMAGCRPEYLPVVVAGVEAMCEDAFDLHGVSATTNFHSPLFIVNGPARKALDINCAAGVFGPGWRANATIGRALRLIVANVGGASARTMSMSTMAHPGRYTTASASTRRKAPGTRWPSSTASPPTTAPSRPSPAKRPTAFTTTGALGQKTCSSPSRTRSKSSRTTSRPTTATRCWCSRPSTRA